MVFSFSPSKPRVANEKKSANTPYKCKLVKGLKPLVNFKFYLDIEKHHLSNKIETKILELGGSVEFFLAKEVTHFVTDKLQSDLNSPLPSPKTPKTPQTPINLFTDVGSSNKSFSNESKTTITNCSRADAMLQRSRIHSQDNFVKLESQSPVQLAKNWGTPIWTTEQTLKYLDKVLSATNNFNLPSCRQNGHHRKLSSTTRLLKGNFIKIESFQKHYRPIFKEFTTKWPIINLNSTEFSCPFESEIINLKPELNNKKSVGSAMTRKSRTKQKSNIKSSSEKQCGYCEICRVEYDLLSQHIKTEKHLNFVKNDDNFLALDNLIKNGATVESFLKLNGTTAVTDTQNDPCQIFSKRSRGNKYNLQESVINKKIDTFTELEQQPEYSPPKTRQTNNLKRESDYNLDGTRRLRRLSCKPVNYAEPKEDEENAIEEIIEEKKTNYRIRGIRWRAPSPQERPPTVKPILFKVEKLTEDNKEIIEDGIIMKIKRIRASELSLLSDEAENFMFPKRESSDCETDDDRQTTSDIAMISTEIISSELDQTQKSTIDEINNRKQIKPVKKRRNHLEKFINDNSEYYKFEDPGSKLRFPNAPTQLNSNEDTKTKIDETLNLNNGLRIDSEDRVGETTWELLKNKNIAKQKFSFERVPNNEPWYLAFQRQDEGTEKIFEYYGHTAYRKLPFEMGPLPPLLTDCCFLNQEQSTAVDEAAKPLEIIETVSEIKTTLKRGKIKKEPKENPPPPAHATSSTNLNNVNNSIISSKQRKLLLEAELVRKSPREHASTLAILSSLVNQRRKRGSLTPVKNDVKSPIKLENQAVPSISDEILDDETCDSIISDEILEESDDVKIFESNTPVHMENLFLGNSLSRQIDELLTVSFIGTEIDEMFDIDFPDKGNFDGGICISDKCEDLVDIVTTNPYNLIEYDDITDDMFNKKPANLNRKLTKAECLILARNNRKKYKKNNRTGWPNNKKRVVIKKEKDDENELNDEIDEKIVDLNNCEQFLSTTKKCKPKSIFNCSQTVFNSINSPSVASRDEFNSDIFTVSSDDQLSLDSTVTNSTTEIKAENDDSVSTRSLFISDEYSSSSTENLVKLKKIKNNEHVFRKNISKISRRKGKLENKVNTKFNPVVRVKKIDESIILTNYGLRRKSRTVIDNKPDKKKISTPKKQTTTTPATPPVSPRKLRKPRGRWYRER